MIVLAGPSGAGKSRLAERLGLPVLRLDDFYKDGADPTLPRHLAGRERRPGRLGPPRLLAAGGRDRDPRRSSAARAAPRCRSTRSPRTAGAARRSLDLDGHRLFVAEGIFAQDVVPACAMPDCWPAAYCVRQHPMVTFWRRLTRDLRERRKPPLVLVRRGLA